MNTMNINNFYEALKKVKARLILDDYQKEFIEFNKKQWGNKQKCNKNSEVLVEQNNMQPFIFASSFVANVLADRYDANIYSFGSTGKLKCYTLEKIYQSFNSLGHLNDDYKNIDRSFLEEENNIIKNINNKNELLNLKYLDISLGEDIYTTYLINRNRPTVDFNDKYFSKIFSMGLRKAYFWDKYFQNHKVVAVIVSHPCYIKSNVIAKMARKYDIPVYLVGGLNVIRRETTDHINSEKFDKYSEMWNMLSKEEQKKGVLWSKRQLERRFNGEIGVDMSYSKKSSFTTPGSNVSVLEKNSKLKILICTHCFFDAPHCYGDMLFPDFYEWLNFLGKISEKTNYDWYLKVHPDYRPGTLENINLILKKYPKIKFIEPHISHLQLVKDGIDFVLTVYGTVGCEYPLLGVQVINAAKNPHIAFKFNHHPKTVFEYQNMLLNLENLDLNFDKEDVYKFYYIHHTYGRYDSNNYIKDDLIINSYSKLLNDFGYDNIFKNEIYKEFIQRSEFNKTVEHVIDCIKKEDASAKFTR